MSTVYTVYAATTDHNVSSSSTTYSTARSGGGTLADNFSAGGLAVLDVGQDHSAGSGIYRCMEAFLPFDLSAVPSPSAASKLIMNVAATFTTTKTFQARITTFATGTGAFVAGASLSALTSFGSLAVTGTGSKTWTGPADVGSRASTFGLILFGADQLNGVTPTSNALDFIRLDSADASGTTNDPRVEITVAVATTLTAAQGSFTLSGQVAGLSHGRKLTAARGDFTLSGQSVNFPRTSIMAMAAGSFAFSGQATAGNIAMPAGHGLFALTGQASGLGIHRAPPASRTWTFGESRRDSTRTFAP